MGCELMNKKADNNWGSNFRHCVRDIKPVEVAITVDDSAHSQSSHKFEVSVCNKVDQCSSALQSFPSQNTEYIVDLEITGDIEYIKIKNGGTDGAHFSKIVVNWEGKEWVAVDESVNGVYACIDGNGSCPTEQTWVYGTAITQKP